MCGVCVVCVVCVVRVVCVVCAVCVLCVVRVPGPFTQLALQEPKHVRSGGAEGRGDGEEAGGVKAGALKLEELESLFTSYDLKRLEAYASNIVDHHIIMGTHCHSRWCARRALSLT